MRTRWIVVSVVLAGAVASGLAVASWSRNGLSARDQPSAIEAFLARRMRRFSAPSRVKNTPNPVPFTAEVFAEGRAHFADHCATCHANDGSGQTEIGQHLYPKAPDMRLPDTQRLTDGELFSIIHNGIRLTGMPAWGNADEKADEDSWKLVHFIRRLKDLTPEDIKEMEGINPKSPAELEEERADRQFLAGEDTDSTSSTNTHHHNKEKP